MENGPGGFSSKLVTSGNSYCPSEILFLSLVEWGRADCFLQERVQRREFINSSEQRQLCGQGKRQSPQATVNSADVSLLSAEDPIPEMKNAASVKIVKAD